MEIYVSVYTNKAIDDISAVYREFMNQRIKVMSFREPRNADYSKTERTYLTYQITLHRALVWGLTKPWRIENAHTLPDGWNYEYGTEVFIHSYEQPIDSQLVHVLCDMFGTVEKVEYKHSPAIGHYHAKITMACATMACALVQIQNGYLHQGKCIFVNFNRFPFA
jgi:hypothetical protein